MNFFYNPGNGAAEECLTPDVGHGGVSIILERGPFVFIRAICGFGIVYWLSSGSNLVVFEKFM